MGLSWDFRSFKQSHSKGTLQRLRESEARLKKDKSVGGFGDENLIKFGSTKLRKTE